METPDPPEPTSADAPGPPDQERPMGLRRRLFGRMAVRVNRLVLRIAERTVVPRRPPAVSDPGQPVRILLMHAWGMGGTIRTTLGLAGHLAGRRDVEVISVVRRRDDPFFPHPPGVRFSALDDQTLRFNPVRRLLRLVPSVLMHPDDYGFAACSLLSDIALVRRLRAMRGGVLMTTRPGLNLIAARLAPPGVVTIGQEHMNFHSDRTPALSGAIRLDYGGLTGLAVLTEGDERDYGRVLEGAPTRIVRIPNAVPPLEGGRADPSAKVVVAAGRLTRQKGFDLLIRAFARTVEVHPDWELRIFGNGPKRDDLEELVARRGLGDRVSLPGSTQRLGEELARGSVFVLSSRFEGFGMVIVEAMSKGLAVVSFNCPRGPSEIIENGVDGVLVRRESPWRLGRAIRRLMDDEERRRELGEAAIAKAATFDAHAIGARWESLLDELVPPGDPRSPQARR